MRIVQSDVNIDTSLITILTSKTDAKSKISTAYDLATSLQELNVSSGTLKNSKLIISSDTIAIDEKDFFSKCKALAQKLELEQSRHEFGIIDGHAAKKEKDSKSQMKKYPPITHPSIQIILLELYQAWRHSS